MKKSTWAARCAAAAIAVGCLLTPSDFAGAQERFPNKPIRRLFRSTPVAPPILWRDLSVTIGSEETWWPAYSSYVENRCRRNRCDRLARGGSGLSQTVTRY